MAISQETGPSVEAGRSPEPKKSARSLVLVAGSGRSGTSLFSGILQRLGFYVPQPEVPADSTNPRGFAESQWVVDFHTRLLARANVQVSDARPAAWSHTAEVALSDGVAGQLSGWLGKQFRSNDHVVVKDPRLSWFLPLWRRCAEEVGVTPRFVTVLRHPAAVVDSKQRSYGGWQSDVSRTAGWLNQTLFTERATREGPRIFVRYEDLLDDWTSVVGRVGEALDLSVIRDASAATIVSIHDFVDRGLSRSRSDWTGFSIPTALQEQVEVVWELISRLAEADVEDLEKLTQELEAARAAYITLYEDAEAIAQSSMVAGPAKGKPKRKVGNVIIRVAGRVPRGYRDKIPLRWRRAAYRAVHSEAPKGR